MNPPNSSGKVVPVYALGYALAIASLVLDIHRGGPLFVLIGFTSSLVLTTLVIYRMARAMAYSPTAERLRPLPVKAFSGERSAAS